MRLRREVHTRQSVLQHLSNYCACERAPTKPSKSPPANPNLISDTTQLRTGMSADIRCHTNRSTRGADGALNALIKRAQHGKPRVGGGTNQKILDGQIELLRHANNKADASNALVTWAVGLRAHRHEYSKEHTNISCASTSINERASPSQRAHQARASIETGAPRFSNAPTLRLRKITGGPPYQPVSHKQISRWSLASTRHAQLLDRLECLLR